MSELRGLIEVLWVVVTFVMVFSGLMAVGLMVVSTKLFDTELSRAFGLASLIALGLWLGCFLVLS